jgi:Beta-lactamase class C and other penicillin binding proteins
MKPAALVALVLAAAPAHAMDDARLAQLVRQRLDGDRTGACMAVAVVERTHVSRTFQCADPAEAGRIGPEVAFEIGSVSKTMTAVLLADLIQQGKGSLDDTLASWLPEGTKVPEFQGQPILLRHVVTHASGLPSLPSRGKDLARMDDPYARLDAEALLASLGDVQLDHAPGSRFEYSNYASMLLSYAVARRAGTDLETLLQQRLFAPLGMDHAYINRRPDGVREAKAHGSHGKEVPAWRFATDLAGAGGVRATLADMVRYVQGGLALGDTPVSRAMVMTHAPVSQAPPMGMNWMIAPVGSRKLLVHDGATGGFSSLVILDPEQERGVVILSDTNWISVGGLASLGNHLAEPSLPLGKPRRAATPPAELLQALVGDYQVQGGMKMSLRSRDGKLFLQPAGQPEYEMAYDDAGDFHPRDFDALLRPDMRSDGTYAFTWMQSGAMLQATRFGPRADFAQPSPAELAAYAGTYPLAPGFELSVREEGGRLVAQATGQGAFPMEAVAKDRFEAPALMLELHFSRDHDGAVDALELHQAGRVLRGQRQAR